MLAVIIAGGDPPPPDLVSDLLGAEAIIAADGGVRTARSLGLVPTVVIGDLDSATSDDLDWVRAGSGDVHEYDAHKDLTDLELALAHVSAADPDRLVVLGLRGGRADHELGNWAAVAAVESPVVEVRGSGGTTWVIRGTFTLSAPVGSLLSLQAWGAPAVVTASGLLWDLGSSALSPYEARGVSNEVVADPVRVQVESGVVLLTRPV